MYTYKVINTYILLPELEEVYSSLQTKISLHDTRMKFAENLCDTYQVFKEK